MRRPALAFPILLLLSAASAAMVGGAREVPDPKTQPEVMFIGSRANFCTGTVIAPTVVLTAAHCVPAKTLFKLIELDAERKPTFKDTISAARHPQFNLKTMLAHRATADVALLKLAAPLAVTPALLLTPRPRVVAGEQFVVRGYGATVRAKEETLGTLREAPLIATGNPGGLQLRLVDASTDNKRAGLGGCTGDSGAPVYQPTPMGLAIYGVVSWSTGPNAEDGCGGLTGVTPLDLYRGWIVEQANKMGAALQP